MAQQMTLGELRSDKSTAANGYFRWHMWTATPCWHADYDGYLWSYVSPAELYWTRVNLGVDGLASRDVYAYAVSRLGALALEMMADEHAN